jgi:hypothetical protein
MINMIFLIINQGSTRMIKKIMFIMGGQVSTQMIKKKIMLFMGHQGSTRMIKKNHVYHG